MGADSKAKYGRKFCLIPKELMLLGNAPQSITERQGREVRRDSVTM